MEVDWLGPCRGKLERMAQMARRLGVPDTWDGIQTGILLRAHAARRCVLCTAEAECEEFLAGGHGHETPPRFCPNVGYFNLVRDNLVREHAEA